VHRYSRLDQCVVLPGAEIGENSDIRRAIIDENCVLPAGTVIGRDRAADARRFHVTDDGVVLVCPHMLAD
jgi:glucose-1-phosphate adenylyltransferase